MVLVILDSLDLSDPRVATEILDLLDVQVHRVCVDLLVSLDLLVKLVAQVTEVCLVLTVNLAIKDLKESKDFRDPWDLLEPVALLLVLIFFIALRHVHEFVTPKCEYSVRYFCVSSSSWLLSYILFHIYHFSMRRTL